MLFKAVRRPVGLAWPAFALTVILTLPACVTTLGGDFDTRRLKALEPGIATRERAVASLGDTSDHSQLTLRTDAAGQPLAQPVAIEKLDYYFLDRAGHPAGLEKEPRRSAWLLFQGERLIGYSMSSTFATDSTDFDTDGIRQLRRRHSTQDDVLTLFGSPSGKSIHPVALEPGGSRWTYRVQWTADHHLHVKTLQVDFDAEHVVVDFALSTTLG